METVTRFGERHTASVALAQSVPDAARTLSAKASYLLSEDGRKASLLAGKDGRALQELTLEVPANRLHLVSVDRHGVARLKLRPRFEIDPERGVARIDALPRFDAPPTIDDLYRAAAKNHELEGTYDAQRTARQSKRREGEGELRARLAEEFLGDKGQRAVAHPPPTPRLCYVATATGDVLFDVATDQGLAKDVPPEAHRRFRSDLRADEERRAQERTTQLALHEEKKRYIADWVSTNGTEGHRARQAAGVLPMAEATEAITDAVFARVDGRRRYERDGADRLREHLSQFSEHSGVSVKASDLLVSSEHAKMASAAEWAVVQEIQSALPAATVTLRRHRIGYKPDPRVPAITVTGVLVTLKDGPFTLRREYLV